MKIFNQETRMKYRFDHLEAARKLMMKLDRFGFKYVAEIEKENDGIMYVVTFRATKREGLMLDKI